MRFRGWTVAASIAVSLAIAGPAAAGDDPAEDSGDVLIDEVGPGWSQVDCPQTGGPNAGPTACFAPDADLYEEWLSIGAVQVFEGVDPGMFVDILADQLGGEPFPTPTLDNAEGRVVESSGDGATLGVEMATDGYVYTLLLNSNAPISDAIVLILDVARRQQDFAQGATPSPESENDANENGANSKLDPLLLTPPPGSGLEIVSTTDVGLDFDDVRSEARSQRVVDLVSRSPTRVRLLAADGVPAVIVVLSQEPYGVFAAAALGALAELPPSHQYDAPGLERLPHAIGFRIPAEGADQLGVAFRKGRYFVLAAVLRSASTDEETTGEQAMELALRQADVLPDGSTAPYFFPSTGKSVTVTVVIVTAICGAAFGRGRIAAARRRRRARGVKPGRGPSTTGPGHVADVTASAAALRQRGLMLAAVDLAAVNAVVVGALGVTDVLQIPTALAAAFLLVGLAGGMCFTAWWARSELRHAAPGSAMARQLRPSVAGGVGVVVALGLLLAGTALVATSVAGLAFGPSLSSLERSQRLHVDPMLLNFAIGVGGIVLLILGGSAIRLSRMWARSSSERLRARDRRRPILYLRSFEDDALRLPTVQSARRPFLELFAARGADPFEESIAWQVAPYGPVVAVGRPGRSLQSLGAAREHIPDDVWRQVVTERMAAAQAIVVILGSTEGLRYELTQLVVGNHLTKTVFVFPPSSSDVLHQRWDFTVAALADSGPAVPALPAPPDQLLAALLDRAGVWRVAVAEVRDEATYRVALDEAMSWFINRPAAKANSIPSGLNATLSRNLSSP